MSWFKEVAPIRQKMLIVLICMCGFAALATLLTAGAALFGHPVLGLSLGLVVAGIAAVCGSLIREAVCVPYVSTVLRMEGLAAGDLDTPIDYTQYQDCVGRMTKAMFTFKETAALNLKQAAAQEQLVSVLSSHLSLLRDGDLTALITAEFAPEYAALKTNFNDAIGSMRELIAAVSESASSISTGSSQIAQASHDLARRTEGNAASLEETVASVTEMADRLRALAKAASLTVQRADQAIATVHDGRATAEDAVQAMGRVSDSAKGIDSVIEGLDKIAFQTRVLAMNAAVEAGRAGDAGRGFAVVADLVSALAMRAEEEAKRARDQLTVTQVEIASAVGSVTKVDGALSNISGDVSQVHELLATMANDNQAQSTAINQISAAIGTMDQSTQQNAAMVEETSAAAGNLAAEVQSLAAQASQFKLENGPDSRSKASGSRRPMKAPASTAAFQTETYVSLH